MSVFRAEATHNGFLPTIRKHFKRAVEVSSAHSVEQGTVFLSFLTNASNPESVSKCRSRHQEPNRSLAFEVSILSQYSALVLEPPVANLGSTVRIFGPEPPPLSYDVRLIGNYLQIEDCQVVIHCNEFMLTNRSIIVVIY
jgi:hypothetical protein